MQKENIFHKRRQRAFVGEARCVLISSRFLSSSLNPFLLVHSLFQLSQQAGQADQLANELFARRQELEDSENRLNYLEKEGTQGTEIVNLRLQDVRRCSRLKRERLDLIKSIEEQGKRLEKTKEVHREGLSALNSMLESMMKEAACQIEKVRSDEQQRMDMQISKRRKVLDDLNKEMEALKPQAESKITDGKLQLKQELLNCEELLSSDRQELDKSLCESQHLVNVQEEEARSNLHSLQNTYQSQADSLPTALLIEKEDVKAKLEFLRNVTERKRKKANRHVSFAEKVERFPKSPLHESFDFNLPTPLLLGHVAKERTIFPVSSQR